MKNNKKLEVLLFVVLLVPILLLRRYMTKKLAAATLLVLSICIAICGLVLDTHWVIVMAVILFSLAVGFASAVWSKRPTDECVCYKCKKKWKSSELKIGKQYGPGLPIFTCPFCGTTQAK